MKPHHWINADGFCHAGDMFEQGTPSTGVYLTEQVDSVLTELAAAREALGRVRELADGPTYIVLFGGTVSASAVLVTDLTAALYDPIGGGGL